MTSPNSAIRSLIALLQTEPAALKDFPGNWQSPAFWKSFFHKTPKTRRLLQIFQELPAFSTQAPKASTPAAWKKLLARDFADPLSPAPTHADHFLRYLLKAAAEKKPQPKKKHPHWRDRFGKTQIHQRIRPPEWNGYLHNPHRGTTTFQRFQGDPPYPDWVTSDTHGPIHFHPNAPTQDNPQFLPRTTLAYVRWPWASLEPKKGQYNWSLIDQSLQTAHNRSQTLQLRFQPYTRTLTYATEPAQSKRHPPETGVNLPPWYWDTGAAWLNKGFFAKHEPDSNDPRYLQHFGDFIRAFGKRYDGHPDLESIDIAYAGFWGEGGGNANPKTAKKLTDIYLRAFQKTQLITMLGTKGCKYAAARTANTQRPVGWRADCFGDLRCFEHPGIPNCQLWTHMWDCYPMAIKKSGVTDTWQSAPITMETCGNVGTWFLDDFDLDTIIREGYRYHMSVFMPKSVFFPQAWLEKLAEFDKKIGYRFALRQLRLPLEAKPGQSIPLNFLIDNVGCAPIYRPYTLALRFRQKNLTRILRLKQDIRQWLPGHNFFQERITIPPSLKKGEAKLDLALVNENNTPKVWLAIESRTPDHWHPLTSIDIL